AQTAPPAAAGTPTTAQGDVAVTIYNNDIAMVQDVRQISFGAGRIRTEFPDVSAHIQPATVAFAADGTVILEQNFDYSLLSPDSLMRAAVGQAITLVRTNPATGMETRERATVLAVNGGVVLRIGDTIEVLRDDGLPVRAIFDRIPPGLRARPTLSVTVNSTRAGTRTASLRYLTSGLSWNADYVALFDQAAGRIDVQGWVTLTNQSGTTYSNAATTLVAGSPGEVNNRHRRAPVSARTVRTGTESANRERLGDFYLYPIAGRTTIAADQTKQVSFLDVRDIEASRGYQHSVDGFNSDEEAQSVATAIRFSTSAAGGLGDALPAGTVRFYQRDRSGAPQFVGESSIEHTPMGSRLSLITGTAFDIKVQATRVNREQLTERQWQQSSRTTGTVPGQPATVYSTEYLAQRLYWRTTMRYTLTNASPEQVEVNLTQDGLNWWYDATRIVSEPIAGATDRHDRRSWTIPVPANGSREFTVIYETRY
ncbi:MAG: DUF4139 domain-containing protein, partial [Sphingopyxis sp.]